MQSSRIVRYGKVVGLGSLLVGLTSFNPTTLSYSDFIAGYDVAPYGLTSDGQAPVSLESQTHAERSNTQTHSSVVSSSGSTAFSQEYVAYNVPLYYSNAKGVDGLRILHLSDLHFHGDSFENRLLGVYEDYVRTHTEPFDLVVITGDVTFEDGKAPSDQELNFLKNLPTRLGKYFVLGNHDYYHGKRMTISALEGIGYQNLTNTNTVFSYASPHSSEGSHPLYLIGLDDWEQGKQNYAQAFANVPEDAFSIVLAHNLDALNHTAPRSLDLILSGHTHACELDLGIANGCTSLLLHDTGLLLNDQTSRVKALTEGTVSYINPGYHHQLRHLGLFGYEFGIPRNTLPPGIAILTLHDLSQAPSRPRAYDLALEPAH